MYAELGGQTKQIIAEAFELIMYMDGAVSYREVLEMTLLEKQLMSDVIEKKFKIQAKNPLLKLL